MHSSGNGWKKLGFVFSNFVELVITEDVITHPAEENIKNLVLALCFLVFSQDIIIGLCHCILC